MAIYQRVTNLSHFLLVYTVYTVYICRVIRNQKQNNMPYITTERVSEIRKQLKKEFPQLKMSITKRNHSVVSVVILSGPEFLTPQREDGYESINYFHISDNYKENEPKRDMLQKVYEIMNTGNYIVTEDSDYGSVPSFYINLKIGDYDKPFLAN